MAEITPEELDNRFSYHPANTQEKQDRHQQVRDTLRQTADKVVVLTGGSSREQSLAITHLEEAMFWANAAIAREVQAEVAPADPVVNGAPTPSEP